MAYTLAQIAHIETDFSEKFGIPRQSGLVEELRARIVFEPEFRSPDAVRGLDGYDYIWLVWQFSTVVQAGQDGTNWRPTVRPPRLGGNTRMGVFATRSMYRPAPVGLSVVQLRKVEKNGKSVRVYVTGSDLLDGTPIVDIKPYIQYSDAVHDAQSAYAQDEPARKQVLWLAEAEQQKQALLKQGKLTAQTVHELEQVLALDPRPAYQEDEDRVYGMLFASVNVKFKVSAARVEVQELIAC